MTTRIRERSLRRPVAHPLSLTILTILSIHGMACSAEAPDGRLEAIKAMHAEGRFPASIAPLRALLAEDPEDPEVLFLYGATLARTGTSTQALFPLRQAMKDPDWLKPAGLLVATGALTERRS